MLRHTLRTSLRTSLLAAALLLAALASCMNPVHSDAVTALGDEAPGVRRGPTHRPGQPCLTCHGGDGPGEPDFELAGTVYEEKEQGVPDTSRGASGVTVSLVDAKGATYTTQTNSVGNFYVQEGRYTPVYPVYVTLTRGDVKETMTTRIGRRGSCADCHRGQVGTKNLVPAVYIGESASATPPATDAGAQTDGSATEGGTP